VSRRNLRFDRGAVQPTKVAAPVISVGNLTVGGTGKTPFVAWLAKWFLDRGASATIISRGYGGRGGRPNDEALELAERLPGVPHIQNPNRIAAAHEALAAKERQVLILDDAFQHRRLARDLDIVLLDALEPFGHGHLLPRGLLREPVEALSRAQVVALSRSDAVHEGSRRQIETEVRRIAPQVAWLELAHRATALRSFSGDSLPLDRPTRKPIAAFCGIGNPAGFRHTLESCGLNIAAWREFSDHCPYDDRTMTDVEQWLQPLDIDHVICTRKDLVKIPRVELAGKRLWALDIELEVVCGREELEAILNPLAQQIAAHHSQSQSSTERARE